MKLVKCDDIIPWVIIVDFFADICIRQLSRAYRIYTRRNFGSKLSV